MIEFLDSAAGLALTLTTLCTIVGGLVYRKLRPWLHDREKDRIAQRDALIGRPAIMDSITGAEIAPALPGIGHRMATMEGAVAELIRSSQRHEAHEAHLAHLDARADGHDHDIAELRSQTVERIVTKAESTAAWKAMEAATLADPDREADQ